MSRRQTWSLLLIAFGLFYLVPLSNHGLWIPDETRYAQISQAMLLGGDWVSPHFLGLRYFEKPVAGYWMIALGQAVFGENLFGVRIASVVATALSVLLAYLLARRLWREHSRPWWFYLPLLAVSCLPWSGLLPSALRQAWHERRQAPVVFLALWLLLPLAFFSLSRGKLPTYIMPCLLPLALLMGHALVQRLRQGNSVALRGNGLLNLGLALLALAALAYLQLRKPVYQEEPFELFLVLLVIGAWAAAGLAQWRYPLRAWAAPLLASWVLIALLPAAMPNHVVQNKTPDLFVAEHLDELAGARHLLSNDLGAASALAWRLRRSDVTLYDTRGELKYGLSYPEHSQRSVPLADIRQWLWRARQDGSVAVLLRINSASDRYQLALLPGDGERYRNGNLVLAILPQVRP